MLDTGSCVYPTEQCPVTATAYGYIPNFGANVFFTTLFGLALTIQIFILAFPPRFNGISLRHWPVSSFALLGTTLSFLGFLSRIWLGADVWIKAALAVEFFCNILAPNLIVSAIYVVLEPVILHCGPQHSRLPAKKYAPVFLTSNATSFVLHTVGGGVAIAHGASRDSPTGTIGVELIVAGMAFQVATMLVLCGLMAEYFLRRRIGRQDNAIEEPESITDVLGDGVKISEQRTSTMGHRLKWFVGLTTLAYMCVLMRCLYRITEFAGGWANPVMRNETAFTVLEGAMIALAWISLTLAHPAFMFPNICSRRHV